MDADSAAELRLVVEVKEDQQHDGPTMILNDRRWALQTFSNSNDAAATEVPSYVCVSYIWGTGRVPNPFFPAPPEISTNTLAALSAAMHETECKAFWIDAFCIPSVQPARRATLESMGFIYSQAAEVRASLSPGSFRAVQELSAGDRLGDEALATLEEDQWVRSVWTYQEVVNSQKLAFVCPEAPGAAVDGSHFLNGIGYTLHKYKERHGVDAFAIRERFPSLDALEDLIADWMIAGYAERSALAVMSNMDRRAWTEERNYFYAMIGAVTDRPCCRSNADVEGPHLSEVFMGVCEAKQDFSFVFSSGTRSAEPGKRWRPGPGLLPSVLPWHCWGGAQPGHFDEAGALWLDRVLQMPDSTLSHDARRFVASWLQREDLAEAPQGELVEQIHSALVHMGFTGSREYATLTNGLFFFRTHPSLEAEVEVIVSAAIRWTLGAPGIAKVVDEESSYIPGVFVGLVDDKSAGSVCLA